MAAPFLIEGAVNGEVFTAYLREVFCPELKKDDLVILDNLSTHKMPKVSELIGACGATVQYLPAYSPDLNPIEMAFAKLQSQLRKRRPAHCPNFSSPWSKASPPSLPVSVASGFNYP